MIKSMLENDLYKFSMGHYYQTMYPQSFCTFAFKDRNLTKYSPEFVEKLKEEFRKMEDIALTDKECEWACENIPYIPRHYWEWLKTFRYDSGKISVYLVDSELHIEVTDYSYKASLYEIPVLATVSELYFKENGMTVEDMDDQVLEPLRYSFLTLRGSNVKIADFGLRRRFSYEVQNSVIRWLKNNAYRRNYGDPVNFVGTSNVHMAMKYDIKPIGTMAHEIFMATASHTSPKEANYIVMDRWSKVYDGDLGIVLTDTFTVDEFLRSFSMRMAKMYDGVRHDSGDPVEFGEKIIEKYRSYGIDPKSKTIVFSDGLDTGKALQLYHRFKDSINVSFGIGTNITNNVLDVSLKKRFKPMNIVMKMTEFRVNPNQPWNKCVKLSDVPGKAMGDRNEVEMYKFMVSAGKKEE